MDNESLTLQCSKCGSSEKMKSGKCRQCNIDNCKKHYEKNKKKYNAASKEWAEKNREKSREIKKKWRESNPEKQIVATELWNERNKDRCAENRKKWNTENKEYKRILTTNRRRKMSSGFITKERVEYLLVKQNGKCPCCKSGLEKFHIDHIMPIALGGSNTDDNIQLLCPSCNLRKNAKHPVDFMQSLGYLI